MQGDIYIQYGYGGKRIYFSTAKTPQQLRRWVDQLLAKGYSVSYEL